MALTGGMSAGKSTLASVLRRKGACYFSLDELAHSLYEPGQPVYQLLVSVFGHGILGADGRVDRGKLGRLVFRDGGAMDRLNGIVHPVLRREAVSAIARMRRINALVVVETGPLLFRLSLDRVVDGAVLVRASRAERLKRLVAGRGLAWQEARDRLDSSQFAERELERDFRGLRRGMVVDSSGPAEQAGEAADKILGMARKWN